MVEWEESIVKAASVIAQLEAENAALKAKLERTKEHWAKQRAEEETINQKVYDEVAEENAALKADVEGLRARLALAEGVVEAAAELMAYKPELERHPDSAQEYCKRESDLRYALADWREGSK